MVAAVVLAVASIAAVMTLQHRASSSRDAQVELGQVQREFDALQSVPYDVIGSAGPATDTRVLKRMEASESRIDANLAGLRADALTPHIHKSVAAYKANLRVLEHIRRLLVDGRRPEPTRWDRSPGDFRGSSTVSSILPQRITAPAQPAHRAWRPRAPRP
jgi:hypothetical protein